MGGDGRCLGAGSGLLPCRPSPHAAMEGYTARHNHPICET